MAFTVVRKESVFGNERVAILKVTTDGATQNVESGLSVIHGISLLPSLESFLIFLTITRERPSISSYRGSSIPRLVIPSLVATM